MTERSTFDSFEQRIASELERYVAPAVDRRPATDIAKVAMRPRGLAVRARNASRQRRILLLGLAAAFLVPAAYLGASSIRPPAPELINQAQPTRTDAPRRTVAPSSAVPFRYVSIFVRRDDGPDPGVSISAVRPDGAEVLVRKVPDSVLPGPGKVSEWGTVSESGWLALGTSVDGGSFPMLLVDLGDEHATPWVINEATTGGIGPRWGPTGLVAASAHDGENPRLLSSTLVIADPETRTSRMVDMQGHGLVGGGPSIVWSADGSGIVGSTGSGGYDIVPIDGGDARAAVGQVYEPRGAYGPGLAELRVCYADMHCPRGDDGRIERVELDGSARTIWQQPGDDRALAAGFGGRADEYWLSLDHDNGRQVALVHVQGGREDAFATINRDAEWQSVAAPLEAPDQSTVLVGVNDWVNGGTQSDAVLVPLNGAPQTFHTGLFAGFVKSDASAVFASGAYFVPTETMPAAGEAYALPPLDDLIAAELGLNPGRRVLGKASREAVLGEADIRTFEVPRDLTRPGDVYVDCFGPSSVTVTSGAQSVTSPCLAGVYGFFTDGTGPVIVTASGDTSWRVVIYSP